MLSFSVFHLSCFHAILSNCVDFFYMFEPKVEFILFQIELA